MQKVILYGKLITKPERINEKSPCQFLMETTSEFKGDSSRRHVAIHKVVVWGDKGDLCLSKLHKGDSLLIEGIIRYIKIAFPLTDSKGNPVVVDNKPYMIRRKDTEIKVLTLEFI